MSDTKNQPVKKQFSPETRRKLSEAASARWARVRANIANEAASVAENKRRGRLGDSVVPTNHDGTSALTSVVKYVPDDAVTARVELLRRLVPHNELVKRLTTAVRDLVAEALNESH